MRLVLALALVAATAGRAAAAPDPFATFVADLSKDPKAAAARLKECRLLVLPGGATRTPCTLAVADLVGGQAGVVLVVKRVKNDRLVDSIAETVEADVDAQVGGKVVASFHVVEVGSSMNEDTEFRPYCAQWARLISDKDAVAKAKAKQLPAPGAIADRIVPTDGGDQDKSDYEEGVHELRGALGRDVKAGLAGAATDGVVFGSAPGQRYAGDAGAKAIAGWKLGLAATGGSTVAGGSMILFAATDIIGTMPDKSTITYAALIVYTAKMIPESGDHVWIERLVSFAVPQ